MKLKLFIIIAFLLSTAACAEKTAMVGGNPEAEVPNAPTFSISAPEIDAAEPAITATKDAVFVVWVEHSGDKSADVFLQKYDAEGKTVGEKIRINPTAGEATAWRGDPPTIAAGSDGAIFVGWTRRVESASGHDDDLILSTSRDGGKTFAAHVKVNDDPAPGVHGMHSLAIDKNGALYVAWLDERYLKTAEQTQTSELSPEFARQGFHFERAQHKMPAQHGEANREVYFAASTDGGKSFSANKKLASDVCPCCKTALAVAPDGKVYCAWRQVVGDNFRHIAVSASTSGGTSFSQPTIVSNDEWQIPGCPVSGANLAVNSNNVLKVVWFTAGTIGATGLYEAESTDGAKTFSARKLISEGAVFGTPVAFAAKTIWSRNEKLYFADETRTASEIGAGELPSAAELGNRLFIAFVKKENDRRAVWLSIVNR